jgi:predicted HTH domain antitoxin
MATVTIDVPDDAFAALHRSPQELSQEMRLAAAMLWYTQGRISHEKAAHLAGISRIAFIDALAAAKLPAFHVDVNELMEEVASARAADRQHISDRVSGSSGRLTVCSINLKQRSYKQAVGSERGPCASHQRAASASVGSC